MSETVAALKGIRVIDMADHTGELAGRVLADLGAEVIVVEPPGGLPARRRPPFDTQDNSMWWQTMAMGKKSVVLDLHDPQGRAQLMGLVKGADVFIETFPPGEAAELGLGYESLALDNPGLVVASITPFGQTGPRAGDAASDLTVESIGGLVGLQGNSDRPPLPVGMPQASLHAGVQAAADILIALHARLSDGCGQHLDVSAQAAMIWTLLHATAFPSVTGTNPPGTCENRQQSRPPLVEGMPKMGLLPCSDGYASINIQLPGVGEATMARALQWIADEHPDLYSETLAQYDWSKWISLVVAGELPVETFRTAYDAVKAAFLRTGKQSLLTIAVQRKLLIAPILDSEDLARDEQLLARNFWVRVGQHTFPGPFAKLSQTPIRYGAPAPELGQHQNLVGESSADRKPQSANAGVRPQRKRTPFAGLKVADFSWVGVGPIIAKALADHGAHVIHVESSKRPDILRSGLGPFKDSITGLNRSQSFANFNTSKQSIDLDLTNEADLRLARKIADWADVVVESFAPGTMARFGLDYPSLTRNRNDLIMLSTSMRGQDGPQKGYTGFGNQGAALAGLSAITGWPDRPPVGPWGAYTDFVAPRYAVAALVAALLHRASTGQGQFIDVSQIETGIHFLGPLMPWTFATGDILKSPGARSFYACPNGVFEGSQPNTYVAIAVESDAQWRALAELCGVPEMSHWSFDQRRKNEADLEAALAGWVARHPVQQVESLCQENQVPAHCVLWPSQLYEDSQLLHRGFFKKLNHGEMGEVYYDGHVTQFSATPPQLRSPGPLLGEHSEELRAYFASLPE